MILSCYLDADQTIQVIGPCNHAECRDTVSGTTLQIQQTKVLDPATVSIPMDLVPKLVTALTKIMERHQTSES